MLFCCWLTGCQLYKYIEGCDRSLTTASISTEEWLLRGWFSELLITAVTRYLDLNIYYIHKALNTYGWFIAWVRMLFLNKPYKVPSILSIQTLMRQTPKSWNWLKSHVLKKSIWKQGEWKFTAFSLFHLICVLKLLPAIMKSESFKLNSWKPTAMFYSNFCFQENALQDL